MANLRETAIWEAGIYQWETSDPVMGGENGIDNRPTRQLANRTLWLKNELARVIALIGSNQTSMGNITIGVGAGLTGGGNLTANRTIGLAVPSTLSGSTTNWVGNGSAGHTHQLALATSQIAGVVKIADNLTTDDGGSALTARQGKRLWEALKTMGYDNLDKGASSRAGIDLNTLTDHGSVTYVNYNGANIAKTLPEWWQKYNLPSAETKWGMVLVYRESANIVYQLFLTALGQVWFRFRSIANPNSSFNHRGWVRLDGAEWSDIRSKPDVALANSVVDLSTVQEIVGEKTFKYQIKLKNVVGNITYGARFGTNNNNTFIQNETSGKYLQLKNDGSLQYDNKRVFYEGYLPTWAQINNKPMTLEGYGIAQEVNQLLNTAVPSGTIAYFAGERAPQGWLIRNGAEISRTVYAKLFAVIGTRFGAGNGSTTFNLPDDRGGFDRAWDGGRGIDPGREFGSWQSDAIRNITGVIPTASWAQEGGGVFRRLRTGEQDGDGSGRDGWVYDFDASRVVPTASENRPVNRAWLPIIKI